MKFHDSLSQVSWQDFEILVANYYREQGFDVMHCGNGAQGVRGSGGVDLRLRKDDKLYLVQCRHGTVQPVDAGAINRLLAVRDEDGAAEAIVVSSADFSADARRAGESGGAKLIDGEELRRLLGERLDALPPPRLAHGIDPNPGRSRIVVKDLTPPSRGRRRGSWRARFKHGPVLFKSLLFVALLGLLVWQVPALQRLVGLGASPAPPATAQPARDDSTVQVPLPTPSR
jgi:restriction system protein